MGALASGGQQVRPYGGLILSRHQPIFEEADDFLDAFMDGRIRGLVQAQGDVQGRDRHGLEKTVEDPSRRTGWRPGTPGRSSPRRRRTSEAKYSVAWRRTAAQKFLPERHMFIQLNLEVKAENPGMLPGKGDSGQEGFFQPDKKILLPGSLP